MSLQAVVASGFFCCLVSGLASAEPVPLPAYDVVVVSGSSGGFAAAVAAGRMGATVALIEDTQALGGMLTSGVSNSDTFSYEALGGIFEEFRLRVKMHYARTAPHDPIFTGPKWDKAKFAAYNALHMDGRSHQTAEPSEGGTWEPHVGNQILKQMVAEVPKVHVFYNRTLAKVITDNHRVGGVVVTDPQGREQTFVGQITIDATHEGDVAAKAGASYSVGREARSELEPHAGEIYFLDETGEIMPGSSGRGDAGVVSYGLRLTVKVYTAEEGPAPLLTQPPDYRKDDYVMAGCIDKPWISMANRKFEMNANPIGNELQEVNWSWPEANAIERRRIYDLYKNHALGFLYFQQHECGNTTMGLPRDEFVDNNYLPYRVYVREGRRIHGEYTMTEADINPFIRGRGLIPPAQVDSIAIGHYPIDAKPVRRKTDFTRPDKGDGDFFLINAAHAFQVPYRAIVPRTINGLLVPVAMSATHVAYSAIRMDPTWMAMGQAAGIAAVLSIRGEMPVRNVSIKRLQTELLQQRSRLVFYWDVPLDSPAFQAIQWLSVKEIITGDEERNFHPNQPLTRAAFAQWAVRAFNLAPSISNAHFTDVKYTHAAFKEIETLFDNGLLTPLGVLPAWPDVGAFTPTYNLGLTQKKGSFGRFEPDRAVTWNEIIALLKLATQKKLVPSGERFEADAAPVDRLRWARSHAATSPYGRLTAEKLQQARLSQPVTRADAAIMLSAVLETIGDGKSAGERVGASFVECGKMSAIGAAVEHCGGNGERWVRPTTWSIDQSGFNPGSKASIFSSSILWSGRRSWP